MNGVGTKKQKLLIFSWNGSEWNEENQKERMEFRENGTLREND
jgi:hypothetical protein